VLALSSLTLDELPCTCFLGGMVRVLWWIGDCVSACGRQTAEQRLGASRPTAERAGVLRRSAIECDREKTPVKPRDADFTASALRRL
jgi:hypothetical protein